MNTEKGELQVVGTNTIEIGLVGSPKHVHAKFVGDIMIAPCDPQDFDELTYYTIQRKDGHYYLVIKWVVSSERTIVWEVQTR